MLILKLSFPLFFLSYVAGFLLVPGVPNGQSTTTIQNEQKCREQSSGHCYPGELCWPSLSDIVKFGDTLDGSLLLPQDELYRNLTIMKNLRVTKYPAMIAVVSSARDVQKSVQWARSRSIHLVVQSSGHDFQGRSTADGALMIYLGNMTDIHVNINSNRSDCPYGEITLESGVQWKQVYLELDKVDRAMIGGSAHTVAVGGYTLGGGHSPISRMYGLAVDNLLEVKMVTADAIVVVANDNGTTTINLDGTTSHSSNTDLIWALRGGGGGTFGIAVSFTFRLHKAPKQMVKFSCNFAMYHYGTTVAGDVLSKLADMLENMPKQWGGYFFMSIIPFQNTPNIGTISMYFNHFGDWSSPSRMYMDQLKDFKPDLQRYCFYQNVSSFWDYEKDSHDELYYRNYLVGTLLQKESLNNSALADFLIKLITYPKQGGITGVTGILLGGTMMNVSTTATSVHPGFRRALVSLAAGTSWGGDGSTDDEFSEFAIGLGQTLRTFGDGSYPNESTGNSSTWKADFWGSNYNRLEQIKKTWDPDNVFMCRQCVGWDRW